MLPIRRTDAVTPLAERASAYRWSKQKLGLRGGSHQVHRRGHFLCARRSSACDAQSRTTCASAIAAGAPVTSLIPALSSRSCRPNAPFAELVRLTDKL
jgi:hypothetical protein